MLDCPLQQTAARFVRTAAAAAAAVMDKQPLKLHVKNSRLAPATHSCWWRQIGLLHLLLQLLLEIQGRSVVCVQTAAVGTSATVLQPDLLV